MHKLVQQILLEIGPGKMSSVAYDTAWIARLGDVDSELSNHALNWLCENQLPDGSWGAETPFYYHDRVISTLAAMIALTHRGRRASDHSKIEKGLLSLEEITSGATQGLMADPNGATIGFEMIVPTLVAEAEKLGIIKQQGERILGRLGQLRKAKLEKIQGRKINRYTTLAFSAEMAGPDGIGLLDIENLQEENGSVGHSPAATAYFASFVRHGDPKAMKYLHDVVYPDGSVPDLMPFEVYETAWTIWNLSLAAGDEIRTDKSLSANLEHLKNAWDPKRGIALSSGFTVPDGDNTSIVFELLTKFGYPVDINGLLSFEEKDYFRCYELEANPSISVNIHALGAFREAGFLADHPMLQKIGRFLRAEQNKNGFWFDKWHISPYYTAAHAIIACGGYMDDIIQPTVEWIMKTQYPDGSWGYYIPTVEETAYCLQALSIWRKRGNNIDKQILRKATKWITEQDVQSHPVFWIGKGLYASKLIVQSEILSAMMLANEII